MTTLAATAPRIMGLGAATLAFLVDQTTKGVVLRSPAIADGVEVLPVLDLVLVRNAGVTFGLLDGLAPWWTLTLAALAVMAALAAWLWRARSRRLGAALGLVIGGALGNVVDRLRHGAVTDFIDLHLRGLHWPAFNMADVAVVCGVAVLLLGQGREA